MCCATHEVTKQATKIFRNFYKVEEVNQVMKSTVMCFKCTISVKQTALMGQVQIWADINDQIIKIHG